MVRLGLLATHWAAGWWWVLCSLQLLELESSSPQEAWLAGAWSAGEVVSSVVGWSSWWGLEEGSREWSPPGRTAEGWLGRVSALKQDSVSLGEDGVKDLRFLFISPNLCPPVWRPPVFH